MDLDAYTDLVIDYRELKRKLNVSEGMNEAFRCKFEAVNKEVALLQSELIKAYINDYRIENYSFELVTNIDEWCFAIEKQDCDYLYQLGIETEFIIRIVRLVKKEFDEKKVGEEQ